MGRVDPEIGDQCLGEALHRELRRTVGGVRDTGPDRRPEAIDAAGIDYVALLGLLQHRQKGAGAVIDAAPADVERPFPFLGTMGDHAAAAAYARVVEQQVDLIGVVALGDLIAEAPHLRCVGDVGEVRGYAQALRQSRGLAETLRLGHSRLETSHIATWQASATN
jgi:hypothetical protein